MFNVDFRMSGSSTERVSAPRMVEMFNGMRAGQSCFNMVIRELLVLVGPVVGQEPVVRVAIQDVIQGSTEMTCVGTPSREDIDLAADEIESDLQWDYDSLKKAVSLRAYNGAFREAFEIYRKRENCLASALYAAFAYALAFQELERDENSMVHRLLELLERAIREARGCSVEKYLLNKFSKGVEND